MKKLVLNLVLLSLAICSFGQVNVLVIDYNNAFSSDQWNNNSIIFNRLAATQTSATRVASIPASINPATYQQVWIFGNMGTPGAANLNPIVNYMNAGGAVYVQSEVSCCNTQAAYLDALINATVTVGGSISHNTWYSGYFEATYLDGCVTRTTYGAACRPFPGTPAVNVLLQATATCGGVMVGKIAGVKFRNCDMISGNGALVGIGDFNVFPSSGSCGSVGILGTPNRLNLIDYIANLMPTLLNCNTTTTPTFDIRDTAVCPGPVWFKSPLINPAYNYLWSNGSTIDSTAINTQGKHWLRIEISPGCFITDTFTITYNGAAAISVNDTAICAGQSAMLTATPGTTGGTYSWSPGGQTTQSITVTPGTTSNYIVTYNLNGCVGTDTGTVTINPIPTVVANDPAICAGQSATITATGNPVGGTYSWSPGGQTTQNVVVTPGSTTSYIVTYDLNGCTITDTSTVTVNPNPTAAFTAPNVCDGNAMQFTDNSTPTPISQWSWDFGDGSGTSTQQNPAYTYPGSGSYTVKLKVTNGNGCSDSITQNITIDPLPTPAFTATPACPTFGTIFADNSTVGTGTVTGWKWDFGDGGTSTTQNPTHNYGAGGTYTVKLIATSSSGCVDSITQNVVIPYKPVANMTWDTVCLGDPTTFADLSTVTNGTITGWNWNFGDGNTSTTQNPTNTYATPGTYTVTLIVTSNDGCTDTITGSVPVSTVPVANFSANTACDGFATQFTDLSTVSAGAISQWSWDFGDGSGTSTQKNPGYTYPGPGSYNVKLIVAAGSGCSDSITLTVNVMPLPQPSFTQTDQCANSAMNFNNTSTISSGTIASYGWDFGDGNTSTQQNPSHTYTSPGSYTVRLIAVSDSGCVDSVKQTVNVFALPVADFSADTVCLTQATCFKDLSTVQNSNINGWQWVFGDGSPIDSTSNPCHTYSTSGTFNVTLIARSAQGCTGSKNRTILINGNPTAGMSVSNICQADLAQFVDQSTITSGTITGWEWNFGDGTATSSQQNPNHGYTNPGSYNVQLVAFAGSGCSDTITGSITVNPMPTADFNFTSVCDGNQLPFTDVSNVSGGVITSWNWNFGDGNTSTAQNPTNAYPGAGSYNVQLIVTTDSGCVDTVVKGVDVYPVPVADFSRSSVCEGLNTQFNDQSSINGGSILSWIWDFGDGSSNQSGQNTSHLYGGSGSFQTTLIVTTANGCVDSITKTVWVNPVPVVDFTGENTEGCAPVCANFFDTTIVASGNIVSYQWDFGDGGTGTGANPSHCYENNTLSALAFNVSLTATSDSGCVSTAVKTAFVNVYPYPVADFTTDYDVVKILNPIFEFTSESKGVNTWMWDFGDGATNTSNLSLTHEYKDTGNYVTWLYVENQWGCRDSTLKILEVEPEFFIYIPNAFTPGRDGTNDKWFPVAYGAEHMDVYIFDRWGELIWEGGLNDKWDGVYKGNSVKTEVFVYLVRVKTVIGEEKEYRGKVTLLR